MVLPLPSALHRFERRRQLYNTGSLQASQDASLKAGNLSVQTAQDLLNVGTIQGGNVQLVAGNNLVCSADLGGTYDAIRDTYAIGAQIGGSNVSVAAGNDLTAQAAYMNAHNALTLAAGHDIDLTDAHDLHTEAHDYEHSSFSFFSTSRKRFGSVDPEWRSHTSSTQISQSTSVGSVLSGDSVSVAAGNNLTATNAQIVATKDVVLAAGNNLTLNAGQNTYTENQAKTTSHTGLMNNGGLSVLIGNRSTQDGLTVNETSYRGSTVGSLQGSVTMSAGNDVHITGSDVLSQTGTAIVGKNVTIDAAVGSTDITQTQKVSQAGINVGLSGGLINGAQSVYGMAQAGHDVQDSRLKALYASQAAYTANDGYNAYQAAAKEGSVSSGINLRLGIGGSSASSTGTTHDETAYGSHIHSAGDITLAATGGDLNIIGSQINGNNVALAAANNLNILSQAEQHTLESSNKNAGGGAGVQLGTSGIGFYAQASIGKGSAHGNGTTHADSSVNATDTLTTDQWQRHHHQRRAACGQHGTRQHRQQPADPKRTRHR